MNYELLNELSHSIKQIEINFKDTYPGVVATSHEGLYWIDGRLKWKNKNLIENKIADRIEGYRRIAGLKAELAKKSEELSNALKSLLDGS